MHPRTFLLAMTCAAALAAATPPGRIMKVLPHLVDSEGRNSLSPSLYERDAYQAMLRKHPEKVHGMEFAIEWKVAIQDTGHLKLRVEARTRTGGKPVLIEQPVEPNHWYDRWTSLTLKGDAYKQAGEVVAWRASLWDGATELAHQKSFLW